MVGDEGCAAALAGAQLRSALWRRESDGQWRCAFHQGTPLP